MKACRTGQHAKLGMDQGHTITVTSTEKYDGPHKRSLDDVDSQPLEMDEDDTRHLTSAEMFLGTVRRYHVIDVECPGGTLLMFPHCQVSGMSH